MTKNKKRKKSFQLYAVSRGLKTGVFKNWLSCAPHVNKVEGAIYKGFNSLEDARRWLTANGVVVTFNDCKAADFFEDDVDCTSMSSSFTSHKSDPGEGTSNQFTIQNRKRQHSPCLDNENLHLIVLQQSEKMERLENVIRHQSSTITALQDTVTKLVSVVEKNFSKTFEEFKECINKCSPPNYASKVHQSTASSPIIKKPTQITQAPVPFTQPSTSKTEKNIDTSFKPEQCVIISMTNSPNLAENFNPDVIRRSINNHFGPTIIEKITPYKLKSQNPRITVQLKNKIYAENMIKDWPITLFGGSTARLTINPDTLNKNSVMMKGVPLDCDDMLVQEDIVRLFPGAKAARLKKNGKNLRTFKIDFKNNNDHTKAIDKGIILSSQSILCHCEEIIHG
jgi:viroplasmin and RNaseH domain-containing protein